jgi:hypothetical protein
VTAGETGQTYFLEGDAVIVVRCKRAWIVTFRGRRARFEQLEEAIASAVGVDGSGAIFIARQILHRDSGAELEPPRR